MVLSARSAAVLLLGPLAACSAPEALQPEALPAAAPAVASAPLAGPLDLRCGDRAVRIEPLGDGLALTVDHERVELQPAVAASGARYEAAGDIGTVVWNKGRDYRVDWRGEALPDCVPDAAAGTAAAVGDESGEPPFIARGHEPEWTATLRDGRVELLFGIEQLRHVAALAPSHSEDGLREYWMRTDDGTAFGLAVADRRCVDSMSGLPHPKTVTLTWGREQLAGCGGDPADLLRGVEWRIRQVGDSAVAEGLSATLVFGEDGSLTGRAGCNRMSGRYTLEGEGLVFPPIAATKMLCPPPQMALEQAVFAVLQDRVLFGVDDAGQLWLENPSGARLLAVPASPAPDDGA